MDIEVLGVIVQNLPWLRFTPVVFLSSLAIVWAIGFELSRAGETIERGLRRERR